MKRYRTIIIDVFVVVAIAATLMLLYQNYGAAMKDQFFGTNRVGIFVRDIPLTVRVADSEEERQRGLSGTRELPATEGMLFFFEQEGNYLFWMKDMLIPIDIFWINDDLKIVHIEKNVRPESYPARYRSPAPARFVLETNAFFADTFQIQAGESVTIPAHRLPRDLRSQ